MNDKVKNIIQPYWVEEQQGVYIPLIDKVLLKNNVPEMSYYDYMEYAKSNGVQIEWVIFLSLHLSTMAQMNF